MPKTPTPRTQIAAAQADLQRAEEADAAASRATLDRLRSLSVRQRFDALGDAKIKLTPEDRRSLLQSLKDGAPAHRPIKAATASRWALFQSRLPYRVVPLTLSALALTAVLGVTLVARARTPEFWVRSRYAQDIAAEFRGADGQMMANSLIAGQRYARLHQAGDTVTLRFWVPRTGYGTASVPSNWVEPVR
ncbi:hypothetical protein [Methylobacterium sp. P5_C11]